MYWQSVGMASGTRLGRLQHIFVVRNRKIEKKLSKSFVVILIFTNFATDWFVIVCKMITTTTTNGISLHP